MLRFLLPALASAAPIPNSQLLCSVGSDPLSFDEQVVGLADNDCCHFYAALHPSTLVDLGVDEDSHKLNVVKTRTNAIPKSLQSSLGANAVVGEIDYYMGTIYTPVHNGTHGAMFTAKYDLSPKGAGKVVDEPLTWTAVDYATELVYAGSSEAKQLFVFDAYNLTLKDRVELKSPLSHITGAALNEPYALYVSTASGELQVINAKSGEVTQGPKVEGPVSVTALANIWDYGKGSFHFATELNGKSAVSHYTIQDSGSCPKAPVLV
jgi:hypothetical protein